MQADPYSPPTAEVRDPVATVAAPFFPVSVAKLVTMSICTMGLYELYWFYENWKRVKLREDPGIWPVARAVFAFFFCYQLFTRVRDFPRASNAVSKLAAGPLAAGWIIFTITWRLPDPFWWISMIAPLFMVPVQVEANEINAEAAPGHDPNKRFTGWNWLGVIVGGGLVLLALIGTFLPEP